MADTPQGQGKEEPLTYPGEVPVEEWVVDFQGDMEESSPIRYVSHEEFLRKKAAAKLEAEEHPQQKAAAKLEAEEHSQRWWHRAARRLRSRNRKTRRAKIKDAMTERELRDAGVAIDLPTEAGSANPQPLRYTDGTSTMDDDMPWNQPREGRGGTSD